MKFLLGCFAFLLAVLLIAAFALLLWLGENRPPELGGDPHVPLQKPDPNKYAEWVDSLNEFSSTQTADRFNLKYGFIDHQGTTHRITCSITKTDHDKEVEAFGYRRKELDAALDAKLQSWLNRELARRGLTKYVRIKVHGGGGYKWDYDMPEAEYDRLVAQINDMIRLLDQEFPRRRDAIEEDLYKERGFLVRNDRLAFDYGALVLRSQQPLLDCFESLLRAGEGYNERQYIGMYLAFVQEIRYEVPPDIENDKNIVGLWVPTEVLVHDHGDCDSKSLALAAMLRTFGLPVVVIVLPEPVHALIGVEMRPGPQQEFVQIGNRYFVLCEAAGPAKLSPGKDGFHTRAQGHFEYTLIESDQRGVTDVLQEGAQ